MEKEIKINTFEVGQEKIDLEKLQKELADLPITLSKNEQGDRLLTVQYFEDVKESDILAKIEAHQSTFSSDEKFELEQQIEYDKKLSEALLRLGFTLPKKL